MAIEKGNTAFASITSGVFVSFGEKGVRTMLRLSTITSDLGVGTLIYHGLTDPQ